MPNTIWLSCAASVTWSAPVSRPGGPLPAACAPGRWPRSRLRAPFSSARLLDAQPVGVGGDHPQRGSPTDTRMPVRTGRVSSRDAALATRSTVCENTSPARPIAPSAGSGSRGKSSAGNVRMWNSARSELTATCPGSGRCSSVTDSPSSARRSRSGGAPAAAPCRTARPRLRHSTAMPARRRWRQARHCPHPSRSGSPERSDRGACRCGPADELQLRKEGVAIGGDLHSATPTRSSPHSKRDGG